MSEKAPPTDRGTLHGVGVGPGDPELVTLRAYRLISGASVVAYPAPEGGESFARAVVADFIADDADEIRIDVPMISARAPAQAAYAAAAEAIAARLDQGDDVVVICEGDPLFYGSFMYLLARLRDAYPVQITPGVSSMVAGAAALHTPLSARDEAVTVIPGTLDDADIEARLALGGAAVIVKVGRRLPRLRALIERLGLIDRAGYVARATLGDEVASPLSTAPAEAPYFSLILIRGQDPFAHG